MPADFDLDLSNMPGDDVAIVELIDDLIYGCRVGDIEEVQVALTAGAPVDGKDSNGSTALMMAAANGHVAVLHDLLSAGADINAANDTKNTALHWAVFTGQEEASS